VRCEVARKRAYLAYLTVGISFLEVYREYSIVERDLLHRLASVHAATAGDEKLVALVHMGRVHLNRRELDLVRHSESQVGELQSLEIEPEAVLAGLVLIRAAEQVSVPLPRVLAECVRIARRRCHLSLLVGYVREVRARLVDCVELIVELARLRLDPAEEQWLTFEAGDRRHRVPGREVVPLLDVYLLGLFDRVGGCAVDLNAPDVVMLLSAIRPEQQQEGVGLVVRGQVAEGGPATAWNALACFYHYS